MRKPWETRRILLQSELRMYGSRVIVDTGVISYIQGLTRSRMVKTQNGMAFIHLWEMLQLKEVLLQDHIQMNRHKELFCSLRRSNSYMLTRYIYLKTFPGNTLQLHQKGSEKRSNCFLGTTGWEQREKCKQFIRVLRNSIWLLLQKQTKANKTRHPKISSYSVEPILILALLYVYLN